MINQEIRDIFSTGKVWNPDDVLVDLYFHSNVGEYDFMEVMTKLEYHTLLGLNLPLRWDSIIELVVPIFVVKQWQILFDTVEFL